MRKQSRRSVSGGGGGTVSALNTDAVFAEMRPQSGAGGEGFVAVEAVVMILFLQLAKGMTTIGVGGEMHLFLNGRPIVERRRGGGNDGALWSGTNKNRDVSTGPLARPFARSPALLTRSLAPDCSLRSRPPLRSLVRSLAHFAHSLARGKVNF